MPGAGDITGLIQQASAGSRQASDALFESVYRELRTIARAQRRRWRGNDTLNTTALINEAYIKLAGGTLSSYRDRSHFFMTASKAMRHVLINYAEKLSAAKRGDNPMRVTLTGLALPDENTLDELLNINAVLDELEASNPRHCRVFECRVFGGMTLKEIAAALEISVATVKRDWAVVSAWVFSKVSGSGSSSNEIPGQ